MLEKKTQPNTKSATHKTNLLYPAIQCPMEVRRFAGSLVHTLTLPTENPYNTVVSSQKIQNYSELCTVLCVFEKYPGKMKLT